MGPDLVRLADVGHGFVPMKRRGRKCFGRRGRRCQEGRLRWLAERGDVAVLRARFTPPDAPSSGQPATGSPANVEAGAGRLRRGRAATEAARSLTGLGGARRN